MKKVLFLIISLSLAFMCFAQKVKKPKSATPVKVNPTEVLISELKQHQLRTDSLIGDLRRDIVFSDSLTRVLIDKGWKLQQRYKMYKTENMYILLKLDTKTGTVYMVQYGMNDDAKSMVVPVRDWGVVSEDEGWHGRFELYPTRNIYNFILLDTYWGHTYQVQWATEPEKRFVRRIWE